MTLQRLSAGVVVVRDEAGSLRFLLLRAYKNWDFPKGLVEPGEDPLAAAVRETAEETGIADLAFDWGDGYCETVPYARGKVARYYIVGGAHAHGRERAGIAARRAVNTSNSARSWRRV